MLVDHRTYSVRAGTLKLQLDLYEKYGLKAQWQHLGKPLAFLTTETGELNTYVHIWLYGDAGDREERRALLNADPAWQVYLARAAQAGYIVTQSTKLMSPVAFQSGQALIHSVAGGRL